MYIGEQFNALTVSHAIIGEHIKAGDLCIDATAGRGGDTAYLCSLVGQSGHVIAFDIQDEAIASTAKLLEEKKLSDIAELHTESHCNMGNYAEKGTVSCITFNFGWLPQGNHKIFTLAETSIKAIETGLGLLRCGGLMSLCIYYGRENGYGERDALLDYFKTIDYRKYSVLVSQFVNRPNCPSIPVFIRKECKE